MSTNDAVVDTCFDAQPNEVWRAITSPDGVEQWMGEGSSLPPSTGSELWLRDFVTGVPREGRVRSVDPDHHITFDWWPEDRPDQQSTVDITLEPLHSGTRVRVVEHAGLAVARTVHASAWAWRSACLGLSSSRVR